MERSRANFEIFLLRNGSTARKCFWHAVEAFTALRNVRYFGCYDALCLCVAVNYIWAYDRLYLSTKQTTALGSASYSNNKCASILRLDWFTQKEQVDAWIESGGDVRVHIPGIGVLDGSNSSSRLLNDAKMILLSQRAWQGICSVIARCFSQMLQGQRPTLASD